jgi:Protein of unknown function, DUF547
MTVRLSVCLSICSVCAHVGNDRASVRLPGARSCPAIRVYSPHNLEAGLESAASNFCKSANRGLA